MTTGSLPSVGNSAFSVVLIGAGDINFGEVFVLRLVNVITNSPEPVFSIFFVPSFTKAQSKVPGTIARASRHFLDHVCVC